MIEDSSILQKAVRSLAKRHPLTKMPNGSQRYYDFEQEKPVCAIGQAAVALGADPRIFLGYDKSDRFLNTTTIDPAIHHIVAKVYRHDLDWLAAFQLYQDQQKHWILACMYADSIVRNSIDVQTGQASL